MILSGPHGGIQTQLMATSATMPSRAEWVWSVMTSVRGLERIAALSFHLTAIEMMVAAQATDLRGVAARLGPRMAALQAAIRQHAAPLEDDRPLRQEIDALVAALASGAVLPAP